MKVTRQVVVAAFPVVPTGEETVRNGTGPAVVAEERSLPMASHFTD